MKNNLIRAGKNTFILDSVGEEIDVSKNFYVKAGQRLIVVTDLIFKARGCKGKIWVKGVVEKGGYLELRGKIKIKKPAQQTDAFLKQQILLLGLGAVGVAVPELEIEANEVKASHAASVSCVDAEMMFYLQSKGLGSARAKKMIVEAFLAGRVE